MDTLSLKVSDMLNTRLTSYARKKGLSKSEIVRYALREYLSEDNTRLASSFLDCSEDLAGSIEGPSDLSKNKNYLDDYGA